MAEDGGKPSSAIVDPGSQRQKHDPRREACRGGGITRKYSDCRALEHLPSPMRHPCVDGPERRPYKPPLITSVPGWGAVSAFARVQ